MNSYAVHGRTDRVKEVAQFGVAQFGVKNKSFAFELPDS
jgi:hypothetical protein